MDQDSTKSKLHPSSLSKEDLAQLLSKIGGHSINLAMIDADLTAGAPVNSDGTMNLVHYAAWLLQEMHRGP